MSEAPETSTIRTLTAAWATIRKHHPDVPEVVIRLGISESRRYTTLAHYSMTERWSVAGGADRVEVMLAAEALARGGEQVMGTLLHEATHGIGHTRGVGHFTPRGKAQYHTKEFAFLGAELGLVWPADCKPHPVLGYSTLELGPLAKKVYASQIAKLSAVPLSGIRRG